MVSKSGDTLKRLYRFFRQAGVPAKRFLFVGDPRKGWLQQEAARIGARPFKVASDLGGRFSVFSPVALVPLALAGVDCRALLKGAAQALPRLEGSSGIEKDVLAARDLVLVTYRAELAPLAFWLQQLWAESLGKRLKDGAPSPFPLPVWCEGPRDQHALFQMFLEGDPRRVFLFMDVEGGLPGPQVDVEGMEKLLPGVPSPLLLGDALRACREGTVSPSPRRACLCTAGCSATPRPSPHLWPGRWIVPTGLRLHWE